MRLRKYLGLSDSAHCQKILLVPASLAQSDARPTCGQEVASLISARSSNIIRWDFSRNIFYSHSHPSADSIRAVISFSWKNVHEYN